MSTLSMSHFEAAYLLDKTVLLKPAASVVDAWTVSNHHGVFEVRLLYTWVSDQTVHYQFGVKDRTNGHSRTVTLYKDLFGSIDMDPDPLRVAAHFILHRYRPQEAEFFDPLLSAEEREKLEKLRAALGCPQLLDED